MGPIKHEEYLILKCPVCGGEDFVFAYQSGYGAITSYEGVLKSCSLHHQICQNCGTVVRSFVNDPEKLLKRKDRKCDSTNI